ncbi:MAG: class I tRNA ligase family protein, partial [Nanoarchaeota archaeon]
LEKFTGDKLEGIKYTHPFNDILEQDYERIAQDAEKLHSVLLSEEYVDTSAGSGLVHCAPGCGPEDFEVGYRNGLPAYNTIDPKGVFPDNMGKFAGWRAKKDDDKFIKALEEEKALIATSPVEHEYPHDWRYHEPVIFRTTKQWFFKIEDLKEQMIRENQDISWVPDAAFNAFDSWLKNLRDNSISKQRYWGTPLPVWRNTEDEEDYIVVGSAAELEDLSGQQVDDLHISTVDDVVIEKDGKTYKRVSDVLDVWVDAGTASWNCLDYPTKKELFEKLFPADFILEGKDQIRGWFNLLMVASMLALERPSFRAVYMHGFVQDAKGRKMSKSEGNYILPEEVVKEYGADTLRYYMIGGSNPGLDINYNMDDVTIKHRNLYVYWNTMKYLLQIGRQLSENGIDISEPTDEAALGIEERYILSRMHSTIKQMTQLVDGYKLNELPWQIESLLLDLSRTYIQLVRDKAMAGTVEEKTVVGHVLFTVFTEGLKLLAPVTPFLSEQMYQEIRDAFDLREESIHLCAWPEYDQLQIDEEIESLMGYAQDIIQSILAARERAQLNVRWPVSHVVVQTGARKEIEAAVERLGSVIASHTNVKELKTVARSEAVSYSLKANFRELGEEFGQRTGQIGQAIQNLDAEMMRRIALELEDDGKSAMEMDGEQMNLLPRYVSIQEEAQEPYVLADNILLDTTRTEELDKEGLAREIMRRIQALRKEAGLTRDRQITLQVAGSSLIRSAVELMEEEICQKCGVTQVELVDEVSAQYTTTDTIKKESMSLGFDA